MALDFQQMQSGLEVAALAKWDAADDTEVVVHGTHNGERYEALVSNVDCEYIMRLIQRRSFPGKLPNNGAPT
jgi:hypothetical protein